MIWSRPSGFTPGAVGSCTVPATSSAWRRLALAFGLVALSSAAEPISSELLFARRGAAVLVFRTFAGGAAGSADEPSGPMNFGVVCSIVTAFMEWLPVDH